MKIGLFDSGIGGTTILEAIKKILPNEEYKYIADTKNCPYGEKTTEELREITSARAKELADWGAEIVVIACNTATTGHITYLREKYPNIKFIGTEPAIKVATDSGAKNILVMATPNTIASDRTKTLIEKNQKPGQNIELLACPGLADTIEKYYSTDNHQPIIDLLKTLFENVAITPDVIVLGCTHYSLIKDLISSFFPSAQLIDGSTGVARRVKSLIDGPKILLLGYGKEGQATEKYFKSHFSNIKIDILENFTPAEIKNRDFSDYDMIFRSPSVPPLHLKNETSVTKYFFDHCPCPIIGVTATKGKGTTCSFIKSLLDAESADAYLVGNIGNPSIDVLDNLKPNSVVVYEMSSFQLWDLEKSPHIAIVGTIEPDHLNVHSDFDDYLNAKANICRHQTANDYLIYYKNNSDSVKIAGTDKLAQKITFPFEVPKDIKNSINLPGKHNLENAIAAIAAVACYKNISPTEYLGASAEVIKKGLSNFHGLPHRLEFVREMNNVKYYDDNFSTNPASTKVAIEAFPNQNIIIIIGGRDKTDNEDIPEIYDILKNQDIKKIILLGESGHEIYHRYQDSRFIIAESLKDAVSAAKLAAEKTAPAIVLMSPSAASFDMFKNVYDRGDQFKNLIASLN